jgi:hypothetical protein
MQVAITAKSRQLGVQRVGNNAWRTGSLTKGKNAIAAGITNNLEKWRANWGRVYQAAMPMFQSLPARTIDPYQNIDNRAKGAVRAWRQAAGKET